MALLDHVFKGNGYHMSVERKQGIQQLMAPNPLKQLRSFLSMVNNFRDFIPNLSSELSALTELTATTKHATFVWTDLARLAFDRIKFIIMEAVELAFWKRLEVQLCLLMPALWGLAQY